MATVFDALTDKFFIAFFEPESEKRRAALEAWIKDATPVIQSAVETELRSYLDYILEQTWTPEGWQERAKKFSGTTQDTRRHHQRIIPWMDGYRFRLELYVTNPWSKRSGEKVQIVDQSSPESHAEALNIAHRTLSQIDQTESLKIAKQLRNTDTAKSLHQNSPTSNTDEEEDNINDDGGRSPNDDRSDSMNPNNDAYQASMDNRSDQMNPNNDAYGSSRGR
jgi:hypothetical protein